MADAGIVGRVFDDNLLERMRCGVDEKRELLPLANQLTAYSRDARQFGILKLEADLKDMRPPLLKKGMQLAVDGTDPEIIHRVMYYSAFTSADAGQELLRSAMIIEGVMAIQQGLYPDEVRDIVLSLLGADFLEGCDDAAAARDEQTLAAYLDAIRDKQAEAPCTLLEDPIARINDQGLLRTMRDVSHDDIATALAKAGGKTIAKFLNLMTVRMAVRSIGEIQRNEHVSAKYAERRQKELLEIIGNLEQTGEVILTRSNR